MTGVQLSKGSWQLTDLLDQAPGFEVMSSTLTALVDEGRPVVVCTADLKYSNGLVRFQRAHPDRFLQFGITEQNMVSAAAGLATTGLQPYVATFASFLALLCCEQIRTDVAYSELPVRLIGHHSGITLGFYGTSHHATEDLSTMRAIAGLTVMAPADPASLGAALRAAADHPEPIYFRIGRGREPAIYDAEQLDFEIGRAIGHGEGSDLTILAMGSMVTPALEAADALREEGISVGVLDMHTIKPLDEAAVLEAAERSAALMTVEEHNVIGGLGAAVSEVLAGVGAGVPLHRHGIRDEYALVGAPTQLYRHYRLDGPGVAEEARTVLGSGGKGQLDRKAP